MAYLRIVVYWRLRTIRIRTLTPDTILSGINLSAPLGGDWCHKSVFVSVDALPIDALPVFWSTCRLRQLALTNGMVADGRRGTNGPKASYWSVPWSWYRLCCFVLCDRRSWN